MSAGAFEAWCLPGGVDTPGLAEPSEGGESSFRLLAIDPDWLDGLIDALANAREGLRGLGAAQLAKSPLSCTSFALLMPAGEPAVVSTLGRRAMSRSKRRVSSMCRSTRSPKEKRRQMRSCALMRSGSRWSSQLCGAT